MSVNWKVIPIEIRPIYSVSSILITCLITRINKTLMSKPWNSIKVGSYNYLLFNDYLKPRRRLEMVFEALISKKNYNL